MKKITKALVCWVSSLFFATVALTNVYAANGDIIDKAMQDKNLSTLVAAVKAAGLVDTLKGTGPFTLFAPTNEAFAKIPKETLDKLLQDKAKLTAILTYHVISGEVLSKDITDGNFKTVEGQDITIKKTGSEVMINDAKVVNADIKASNGVIHEINTVLMPPSSY